MNIKSVRKRIKEEGLKRAIDLYLYRKSKKRLGLDKKEQKQKEEKKDIEPIANFLIDQWIMLWDKADFDEKKDIELIANFLIDQWIMLWYKADFDEEQVKELAEQILPLEKKKFKKYLKRRFIKKLMPEMYDKYREAPVENKIIFLQPRMGLNQSCRYFYKKLERETDYELKLYELHRNKVPNIKYFMNCLEFAKDMATAKAVMVHESSEYFGYLDIRKETKLIQLWHGCGIIKSIGMSNAGKEGYKTIQEYKEFPEYNKYDLVTIASDELRWVFEEFMGKEKGDPVIQSIGVARTDEFFDREFIDNSYKKLYQKIPQAKGKKVILYAPTYRGLDPHREAPDKLDIAKFAEVLGEEYILIIKHHQTVSDLPVIPEAYRDSFAFDMTRGKGMNINELMTVADVCISDYSSLIFEFALFERPIIFFMYDMEEYEDKRGMYYSYEELAECGPIFKENEEMIAYLSNLDQEFDKQKVVDFKNKFMSACDGHSCERIMQFIETNKEEN